MNVTEALLNLSAIPQDEYSSNISASRGDNSPALDIAHLRSCVRANALEKYLTDVFETALNTASVVVNTNNTGEQALAILNHLHPHDDAAMIIAPHDAKVSFGYNGTGEAVMEAAEDIAMPYDPSRSWPMVVSSAVFGALVVRKGWLVSEMTETLTEKIGEHQRSYSATSTVTGIWRVNPEKVTRIW